MDALLARPHRPQVLEAELGRVPRDRDPAQGARLVAVDRVPHHRAHEAADRLEARAPVELGHAHRHLVAAFLAHHPARGGAEIGFPRAGADPRVGLHPRDQLGEIAGGQVEIEVELAEIGVVGEVDPREPVAERLDDAGPHRTGAAVGLAHHLDPGVPGGIVGEDRRRLVGRAVVHDHPFRRAQGLRHDAVEGAAHVGRLVAAGRDQQIGAGVVGAHAAWPRGHGSRATTRRPLRLSIPTGPRLPYPHRGLP